MPEQIIIKYVRKIGDSFASTVQFGLEGSCHDITITPLFSGDRDTWLEWEFETWPDVPITDKDIRDYGEHLFHQVFLPRPVWAAYGRIRKTDFQVVIIGPPEFQALNWEAMHDPELSHPLSVEKSMVRQAGMPLTGRPELRQGRQFRILLVTSRAGGDQDANPRTMGRTLVATLETEEGPVSIDMVRPGTFEALVNHLEDTLDEHGEGYYHGIHLDVNGELLTFEEYQEQNEGVEQVLPLFRSGYVQNEIEAYPGHKAFLYFDDYESPDRGRGCPVSDEDLARLFNLWEVPMVVVHACGSGSWRGDVATRVGARLMDEGVPLVVAMGCPMAETAFQLMMKHFYGLLLAGEDPATAVQRARFELCVMGTKDWLLPVLYQSRPFSISCETFQGLMGGNVAKEPSLPPEDTFYGRDVDILAIEHHLLEKRNLLLVKGLGGVGKTALFHYLGAWWRKTRFVTQVFYWGYDKAAYTLQDIVETVGDRLALPLTGIADEDRQHVVQALKGTRHLLVLDHLESVTGDPLARQTHLAHEDRNALTQFLNDLVRGRTVVLLGSRGGGGWLNPDPVRDGDVYELSGLDDHARNALAQTVLDTVGGPGYPDMSEHRPSYKKLLRLMGGHPLSMNVVLPGLAQNTPSELLDKLHLSHVKAHNTGDIAQKTENLIKSAVCSHGNLATDIQDMMLCLAPFAELFHGGWKDFYLEHLKARPELSDLPFEQWQALLLKMERWGLVRPHDHLGGMGYLSLEPVFPCLLTLRLNEPAMAGRKNAIERAFCDHYNEIGQGLATLITSNEDDSRQTGQALIGMENENLLTAVTLGLENRLEFFPALDALMNFMIQKHNVKGVINLCEWVLSYRDHEGAGSLDGPMESGFALVQERLSQASRNMKDTEFA